MNENYIIIGISGLIIFSYASNLISKYLKISSVLLILGLGVITRMITDYYGAHVELPSSLLKVFGTVGLILIVLEGTMDAKFSRDKIKLIRNAFWIALLLLLFSSFIIAQVIMLFTHSSFYDALLYAIALSVISSAIVIPSVANLSPDKKEFMIYESTFSDILGIILFNFFAFNEVSSAGSFFNYAGIFILTVIGSILFSALLIWAIEKISTEIKFYLILAITILFYALGKIFHLSSLMLVMCFGFVLNNVEWIVGKRLSRYFDIKQIQHSLKEFKPLVLESSFVVRTFFFFLFGYSIQLNLLFQQEIWIIGLVLTACIYLTRYINLRFFIKADITQEIFIAPRGLITILLFYSIPNIHIIENFNEGILFFIIIITSLMMMFGLFYNKKLPPSFDERLSASPNDGGMGSGH